MVSALNHEIIEKSWDVTPLTDIRKDGHYFPLSGKGESSALICLSRIRKNCLCGFKIRPLQGFLLFLASQSCIPMYCAIFQGEESTEGVGGKGEGKASGPLFKEATELWHNLRSLAEWSIPLRMMVNQLLCTCSAPWLPLEGSSLVMTLGWEWTDHSECEHDQSVPLCTHITLFKWLLAPQVL